MAFFCVVSDIGSEEDFLDEGFIGDEVGTGRNGF